MTEPEVEVAEIPRQQVASEIEGALLSLRLSVRGLLARLPKRDPLRDQFICDAKEFIASVKDDARAIGETSRDRRLRPAKIAYRYSRGSGVFDGWHVVGEPWSPFTDTDHGHAWWCARQLQLEQHYDFVPYTEVHKKTNHAWLRYDCGVLIGCVLFVEWPASEVQDAPVWELAWVWFDPRHRRRRILTFVWPRFRALYGDFYVQGPLSDAMRAFLRKPGMHARNYGKPNPQPDGLEAVARAFR